MALRLHFQIDPHSGVPAYRQLMDQVKYYVASGTLSPGDQLPSIRELAQALTVNPTTVVKAFNELAHESLIELRQGRGAYVAARAGGLPAKEQEKAVRRLARQLAVEAAQMGFSPDRVARIVAEELDELNGERSGTVVPLRPAKV
jgi:GntR family transcriptional regulator